MDQIVEKWFRSLVPVPQVGIPELTEFQANALTDVAQSENGLFMVAVPNDDDPAEQIELWSNSNAETDQLVDLGLVTEVSDNFRTQVENSWRNTGRRFRIFAITQIGKEMFDVTTNPRTSIH